MFICLDVISFHYLPKVFDLLSGDTGKELVDKLQKNTQLFRERMVDAGFTLKVRPRWIISSLHRYDVICYVR